MKEPLVLRLRIAALLVLAAASLGGCMATKEPLAQCEPGVVDLSRTADVAPGNC